MTIFSSFSANFPPHYHTILAINCVHASNWFTHLQQTQQTDDQNDNVLTVNSIVEVHDFAHILIEIHARTHETLATFERLSAWSHATNKSYCVV